VKIRTSFTGPESLFYFFYETSEEQDMLIGTSELSEAILIHLKDQ
jgi:hypothetical protein